MIQARHVVRIAGATLVGGLLVVFGLWGWERSVPAYRHLAVGMRLAGQYKPAAALSEFRRAVDKEPRYVEARWAVAYQLWCLKRFDEAIAECHSALAIDPRHTRSRVTLALALRSEGRWDEAIAEHRKAVEIDPGSCWARDHLCSTLLLAGRLDESVAECRRGIRLAPRYFFFWMTLAHALHKQGKLDEAIAACGQAQRIDWFGAGSERARLLYAKGDYAGAWREVHWLRPRRAFPLGDRDKEFLAKLQSRMAEPKQ